MRSISVARPRLGQASLALLWPVLLFLPLSAAADQVADGQSLYREFCVSCHGRDLQASGLTFDLRKFPKNDAQRFRQSVLNGKGQAMPAWNSQLSAEDVQALWAYVLSGG